MGNLGKTATANTDKGVTWPLQLLFSFSSGKFLQLAVHLHVRMHDKAQ